MNAQGAPDPTRVFVVHGRNRVARDGMFAFLKAVGLEPIEWSEAVSLTGEGSPYIGQVLDAAFSAAQAIVVLLTPDEITYLRTEYADTTDDPEIKAAAQARPNVLFEAGMAMGRNAARTVLVELGHVRPFSDVAGRHALRLDGALETRKSLIRRLETAGCRVDTSRSEWETAGDLTPPPPPGGGIPLGKRVPDQAQMPGVKLDLRYHDRSNSGRLEVINRGKVPVFDVALAVPDGTNLRLVTDALPIPKLPPGKSVMLIAIRFTGPGKDYAELRVTGRTEDGSPIDEEIFVSFLG